MTASEVERVRMTASERRLLQRLARETHSSKSDVLRKGLNLVARIRERSQNLHVLLAAARLKGDASTKARLAR